MGLLRWFTKNWANTIEPTHPDLHPLELALPVEEAVPAVEAVAASMRRWCVVSSNRSAGTLHLTRRTRVFRFVDDVRLTFEPAAGGCRVHADSRSRVGVGDLGQNRRNVRELFAGLRRAVLSSDAGRR
jgi:uncharacterized protein (DUF1499 family)